MAQALSQPHIVVRFIHARPLLLGSMGLAIVVLAALTQLTGSRLSKDILVSWNIGAGLYLVLTWITMLRADEASMHKRAERQDVAQTLILILSMLSIGMCLTAIVAELSEARSLHGLPKDIAAGLVIITIVTSWAFVHTIFALHYAHAYYVGLKRTQKPCLGFPDKDPTPDYLDFLYFSLIIGTAAQTADVAITSKPVRRTNLFHCVFAFFFNTIIVALVINIAASMVS